MKLNLKKTGLVVMDIVLGAYLILAFTAFNKPDEKSKMCTKVNINIQDESTNGFINAKEIKNRLEKQHQYPLSKKMIDINTRQIEESLKRSAFVKTAECYKTQDGTVCITLTQRMPIVRIKSVNGDDYYVDDSLPSESEYESFANLISVNTPVSFTTNLTIIVPCLSNIRAISGYLRLDAINLFNALLPPGKEGFWSTSSPLNILSALSFSPIFVLYLFAALLPLIALSTKLPFGVPPISFNIAFTDSFTILCKSDSVNLISFLFMCLYVYLSSLVSTK